jgi:hypothetical protein
MTTRGREVMEYLPMGRRASSVVQRCATSAQGLLGSFGVDGPDLVKRAESLDRLEDTF